MKQPPPSPITPQAHLFESMVIGLQEAGRQSATHWLDGPALRRGLNGLAVALATAAPLSARGWQALLSRPVRDWWPATLPRAAAFESDFSLLEDGELSEEANRFYYTVLVEEAGLAGSSAVAAARVLDNQVFAHLLARLRDKNRQPATAPAAQRDYVRLRQFLIEHPLTTAAAIGEAFEDARFIRVAEVGELYEPAGPGPHWHCQHCGPLHVADGGLRGIRPRLCADHLPGSAAVLPGPAGPGEVLRLRPGHLWRVCLPGKPELALYAELLYLHQQYPQQLAAPVLWPGLDQYDLRLGWPADGTHWAVDVKDQQNPRLLGQSLYPLGTQHDLAYDRAFYVVPDRWLTPPHGSTYLRTVRQNAKLPATHSIVGLQEFLGQVTQKVTLTTRAKRPRS
ncbi:hypothetical protein GKZ68_05905 [Hymenobacter sp. BRD128]|uniref:restriction endonuclease-related protein n=1 Tax=Hymenobacter sp. BRD128 TaxID=2675878 RepID=UPI0015656C2E|nr:hypothetical protein [Hymenobacter sp. BRD128]QKG56217.1 hypothetical protein GKZ68_05905 [Hymenobacter sp. BRD128]